MAAQPYTAFDPSLLSGGRPAASGPRCRDTASGDRAIARVPANVDASIAMSLTSAFRRPAALVALMLACGFAAPAVLAAERAPVPSKPLASDLNGRVIVKFKDDAGWRKQILAAREDADRRADPAQVHQLLQQRAGTLGQRLGLNLQSVAAIEERMQVLSAHGVDSVQLAARIAADPQVEYAVPDGRRRAARVPNDPLFVPTPAPAGGPSSGQWYLKTPQASRLVNGNEVLAAIDAQAAWDLTTGTASTIVAVLDTGIRADHPDLAGKVVPGIDMVTDTTVANDGNGRDDDPSDPGDWVTMADKANSLFSDCEVSNSSWHGTQVAGLIGAATDNGTGMAGAGWNVRVQPVRVLGKCFGYDSDIIAGIRWAAGLSVPGLRLNPTPASVINLSLGGEGACNAAYTDVIREVANRPGAIASHGAVVVAAAGNTTGRAVNNPANCAGAIGVAAVRHIGTKVGFSDLGPQISVAAPGGNCVNVNSGEACLFPLLTTTNRGATTPAGSSYSNGSDDISVGTSFAAPLVSATAGLMLSVNPSLTPAQVRQAIMDTTRAFPFRGAAPDPESGAIQQCRAPGSFDQLQCYCTTDTCGAGLLDSRRAVAAVAQAAPRVLITVASGSLAATRPLVLSAGSTTVAPGRTVTAAEWTVVDDGGVIGLSAGAQISGTTVSLTPTAAGRFSVRLAVTDSAGVQGVREQTFEVASAPPPEPEAGGGGALSVGWLALLGLATLLSGRPRRRA